MSSSSKPAFIPLPAWLLLFTICLLVFLMNIDYTAVNQALLPIADEIKVNLNDLQWLLSGYVLVWGALVVPAGRMADIFGKKISLIIGMLLFMAGSLLTGMGQSIEVLVVGRVFQGIGAAIFSAPAYGLVFTSMPSERQGTALGIIGGIAGLGLAAGPTLAGFIIETVGWRWIFYVNIPLGLIVIGSIYKLAQAENMKLVEAKKLDPISIPLLAMGLVGIMFALNQIEIWGFSDPKLLGVGALSIVVLGLFILRDRKSAVQVIPNSLLKNKPFRAILGAIWATSYNFSMTLIMVGLYLQNSLQLSNFEASLVFLAFTLALGALAPFGGKLVDHFDARVPILTGLGILVSAGILMSFFSLSTGLIFVVSVLILAGIGQGLSFPSINTLMFKTIKPEEMNTGSAIFTMAMMMGNTISVIASTSLVVIFGRTRFDQILQEKSISLTDQAREGLVKLLMSAQRGLEKIQVFVPDGEEVSRIVEEAFISAFAKNMLIGAGLSALAVLTIARHIRGFKPQKGQSTEAVPMIL